MKQENKYLRRRIAFTRLVKHLYNFDSLTPLMIHRWIKQLLANQSDKSLEFFCMLMKVLGETFEADTKVWLIASKDKQESSEFSDLSVYMEEIERLVHQRKTSMKVRFMMMVVIRLYNNGWKKRDLVIEKESQTEDLSEPLVMTLSTTVDDETISDIQKTAKILKGNDVLNAAKKQRT